jgi:hypothetical protein
MEIRRAAHRTAVMAAVAVTIVGHARAQSLPSGDDPEKITSVRVGPGQGRSSVWTETAIRNAQPVPLPKVDPQEVRAAFRLRRPGPATSGATDPSGPTEVGRQSGNVHLYPLTIAGQLFYNAQGDKPGWGHACTAQFVAPNVILTAAHCVQDDKPPYSYHSNFMFALEYAQGASFQKFGYGCVANKKGWAMPGEEHWLYDYAMIETDASANVGWFGMQWNWDGLYQQATKIGYPSGSLNGEVIQVDKGPLSVSDGIVELKHGNMNVQHGASGGAWIGDYSTNPRENTKNHIISVQSFSHDETSGISYGPAFTDSILSLLNYVKADCRNP